MSKFYKITLEEINNVGRFHTVNEKLYDLQTCEQEDGSFIVSEDTYNSIKDIASIDFSSKQMVKEKDLQHKKFNIKL